MLEQREGDTKTFPFRTGRYFNVNGEWYFSTREVPALGPFNSRERAEEACVRFLASKRGSSRRAG